MDWRFGDPRIHVLFAFRYLGPIRGKLSNRSCRPTLERPLLFMGEVVALRRIGNDANHWGGAIPSLKGHMHA